MDIVVTDDKVEQPFDLPYLEFLVPVCVVFYGVTYQHHQSDMWIFHPDIAYEHVAIPACGHEDGLGVGITVSVENGMIGSLSERHSQPFLDLSDNM